MKILNVINTKWTKTVTCRECKSELEIEESDLYVYNNAVGYAGETWEPEVSYDCGVCHSRNCVDNKIPSGIKYKLVDAARAKRNS